MNEIRYINLSAMAKMFGAKTDARTPTRRWFMNTRARDGVWLQVVATKLRPEDARLFRAHLRADQLPDGLLLDFGRSATADPIELSALGVSRAASTHPRCAPATSAVGIMTSSSTAPIELNSYE
jgi:hypothetical protein